MVNQQVWSYYVPNFNQQICVKNFFKAEICQLEWNSFVLSYQHWHLQSKFYQQILQKQTNLYLFGVATSYDSKRSTWKDLVLFMISLGILLQENCRSIWLHASRYNIFYARGNAIFSLPTEVRSIILYSLHASYVLVDGIDNLQSSVDVYDCQNSFQRLLLSKLPKLWWVSRHVGSISWRAPRNQDWGSMMDVSIGMLVVNC